MISLIRKARNLVRKLDSLEVWNEGGWKYFDYSNPIFSNPEPIGRYVFYRPETEVQNTANKIMPFVGREQITRFKHALSPLPGDAHFPNLAFVVYADNEKHKTLVGELLDRIEIRDHEWKDGNPVGYHVSKNSGGRK